MQIHTKLDLMPSRSLLLRFPHLSQPRAILLVILPILLLALPPTIPNHLTLCTSLDIRLIPLPTILALDLAADLINPTHRLLDQQARRISALRQATDWMKKNVDQWVRSVKIGTWRQHSGTNGSAAVGATLPSFRIAFSLVLRYHCPDFFAE
jgi:hypothetical protein